MPECRRVVQQLCRRGSRRVVATELNVVRCSKCCRSQNVGFPPTRSAPLDALEGLPPPSRRLSPGNGHASVSGWRPSLQRSQPKGRCLRLAQHEPGPRRQMARARRWSLKSPTFHKCARPVRCAPVVCRFRKEGSCVHLRHVCGRVCFTVLRVGACSA